MKDPMIRGLLTIATFLLAGFNAVANSQVNVSKEDIRAAMQKATKFFVEEVSAEGGYLWRYSHDLAKREGEGRAAKTTVWVQPPGTPAVGMAFLDAFRLTGDESQLRAANAAADALIRGQLRSGGWTANIEFDPKRSQRFAYRVDPAGKKRRNVTSLDDDMTQSSLRFLMQLDKTLEFKNEKIHEAVSFALASLLAAQYPNGGWPQGYSQPPDPKKFPVKKANYPETWSRIYRGHNNYWNYYTLNDNVMADTIETLFLAARVYAKPDYRRAALKAADFLLLAQMPDPQPAWAQQYDLNMHPAWARKFEPPAVTGGESIGVMRTLLSVYMETGDKKYLEPIPRALKYFRKSRLEDGQLARFYELKTNKPLYFTRDDYKLTYDDNNMPTHYSFKVPDRTNEIQGRYDKLRAMPVEELKMARKRAHQGGSSRVTDEQVRRVIAAMDGRGAWVETGRMKYFGSSDTTDRIIDCNTFIRNLGILARYLGQE